MAITVLRLDMLLQESCIDLQKVAELVLSDVGATIQTLRLAGREYKSISDRPIRMVECIASLDVGKWLSAIASRTFACGRANAPLEAVWRHCYLVAQYAQLIAESVEEIQPEDAYLVGLLHDIEKIPSALGWPEDCQGSNDLGSYLASELPLPGFVLTAMQGMHESHNSSTWKFILASAHKLAEFYPETDKSKAVGVRSR